MRGGLIFHSGPSRKGTVFVFTAWILILPSPGIVEEFGA